VAQVSLPYQNGTNTNFFSERLHGPYTIKKKSEMITNQREKEEIASLTSMSSRMKKKGHRNKTALTTDSTGETIQQRGQVSHKQHLLQTHTSYWIKIGEDPRIE